MQDKMVDLIGFANGWWFDHPVYTKRRYFTTWNVRVLSLATSGKPEG